VHLMLIIKQIRLMLSTHPTDVMSSFFLDHLYLNLTLYWYRWFFRLYFQNDVRKKYRIRKHLTGKSLYSREEKVKGMKRHPCIVCMYKHTLSSWFVRSNQKAIHMKQNYSASSASLSLFSIIHNTFEHISLLLLFFSYLPLL
jgi:hypothetical protein